MHIPVFQKEVIQFLAPKPNEDFIDCTIGFGGHALTILEKTAPNGKLLGIDRDSEIIENCKLKIENFKERVVLVCDNFVNLKEIVKREKFGKVAGILFDLGLSIWHLEKSGRGFSFLRDEPLDMRYDIKINPSNSLRVDGEQNRTIKNQKSLSRKQKFSGNLKIKNGLTAEKAEKIVNYWPAIEIEKILKEYGEERFAKRITGKIIETREIKPIKTTFQLVEIIRKAVPGFYERGRIHPATRTFQALRLAVNDELKNLEKTLPRALETLEPEGRLVLISFHSLEDRLVKNFLKNNKLRLKILTKKPISPSLEEIRRNPRSRSAKLRAAIKL